MSNYRWMRASDQDREEAAALLGDAYAVGRLTREEFDQRCAAACAARTWGQLDDLTADLPVVCGEEFVPAGPPRQRPAADQQLFWPVLPFALLAGQLWCTARWAASTSSPKSACGSRHTEWAWLAWRWVLSYSMSSRGPCSR